MKAATSPWSAQRRKVAGVIPSSRLASPRLSHGERIRGVRAARTRRLWRKLSKTIDFRTRPDLDESFAGVGGVRAVEVARAGCSVMSEDWLATGVAGLLDSKKAPIRDTD